MNAYEVLKEARSSKIFLKNFSFAQEIDYLMMIKLSLVALEELDNM